MDNDPRTIVQRDPAAWLERLHRLECNVPQFPADLLRAIGHPVAPSGPVGTPLVLKPARGGFGSGGGYRGLVARAKQSARSWPLGR